MSRKFILVAALFFSLVSSTNGQLADNSKTEEPKLLDDQFVLPKGFHIYRMAKSSLTGGSYDVTFDGQGRLLVGDGNAVRRLKDDDGNGIFDSFEVIADGKPTSGRGPQGLLVYGDHLYVVAGDGVQLFSGYDSGGKLKHEKRIGANFNTGGDHAAHTVLRGIDGHVYLVTGDGGGTSGRKHITEDSSPVREERAASVFRFDPKGEKWECIGAGGRNPPSLGMNYLGEFFSFDSDMEFHVDVPFYRPVSLNHWATGADLGWQGVGAFRRYYIDSMPAVLEVGRGSPNWGVVYEHHQFPKRFRDAFICCDYRWKSATTGGYATSGRLVTFHLKRKNASWTAEMTELAKAKPNAKDADGNPINFALVDVDVAPDGSLVVTDHNQGIWRIFYDDSAEPQIAKVDEIVTKSPSDKVLAQLLTLPQPASEWSRLQQIKWLNKIPAGVRKFELLRVALDTRENERTRLRAIRILAPDFNELPKGFLEKLLQDESEEIVAQAVWLIGIRGRDQEVEMLHQSLASPSAFVRRRAAEALCRVSSLESIKHLVKACNDANRSVRYAATLALSHQPTTKVVEQLASDASPQQRMRVLVASHLRKERPSGKQVAAQVKTLLADKLSDEDLLDCFRILNLYRNEIKQDEFLRGVVTMVLLSEHSRNDSRIRWERIRLLGDYGITVAYGELVKQLLNEKDHVTQFHIATAIGKLPVPEFGFPNEHATQLAEWLITTQTGWFSEFGGKGLQFPGFWGTTLQKLAETHVEPLAKQMDQLKPNSQLSRFVLSRIQNFANAESVFFEMYANAKNDEARSNVLGLFDKINSKKVSQFLEQQLSRRPSPEMRNALVRLLATNSKWLRDPVVLIESLLGTDDPKTVSALIDGFVLYGKKLTEKDVDKFMSRGTFRSEQMDRSMVPQLVNFHMLEAMSRNPVLSSQVEQALIVFNGEASPTVGRQPRVIWSSTAQKDGDKTYFIKQVAIEDLPRKAEMVLTCDNEFILYVNGKRVAAGNDWTKPQRVDLTKVIVKGKNLIAVEGRNQGGPAGLIASLTWRTANGRMASVSTDSSWMQSTQATPKWQTAGTQKGSWATSVDVTGPTENAISAFMSFVGKKQSDQSLTIQEYWNKWYLQKYKVAFVPRPEKKIPMRPDNEILALIKNTKEIAGDKVKGRAVYLKAGCYACHGGIENKTTTIFGPALGGVTLRLKREELADAIVFPSKQVVERFKASLIETIDGKQYTGFVTESTDDVVTITDIDNNITRIPRGDIEQMKLQNKSLMPEKLLNQMTDAEIRDLLAFLKSLK